MNIKVRIAKERDAKEIASLLYQVHDVHANIRPDLFKKSARKYNEDEVKKLIESDETIVFVGEFNNKVLGYAICFKQYDDVKTLYIDDICVDEKYRHNHVGKQIFDYLKTYAKDNDVYHLVLRVWKGNEVAYSFYESLGFEPLYTGMEIKL